MEKVINFFGTFFDINTFSLTRLGLAISVLVIALVLKGWVSRLIIKLFNIKEKDKEALKANSFYNPLRLFFASLGILFAILILNPTEMLRAFTFKIFRILVIFLISYSIGNLVSSNSKFEQALKRRISKANDSMIRMICKALKLLIYVIAVLVAISELGYDISGIIAGLGIGGVVIALAAQDTASNILGAVMILLDRPFEVGDWICIGTVEGSVEEFTFRSTRIREAKNSVVAIPNSTVVNSSITNWSRLNKRRISMDLVLEFDTPLKKVADVQNELLILLDQEKNIFHDGICVKFSDIKTNGYNLKIFCYTHIINYLDYLSYLDQLNFKIMYILNTNKVNLAYNSQSVYIKK